MLMAEQAAPESGLLQLLPQEQEQEQHKRTPEHLMYKNRLQEFTQRASIPFPIYHTINEGGPRHAPQFKSTVEVDGKTYTCSNTFSNRKAAEQDAARVALEGIVEKIKDTISNKTTEGEFPPIHQDKVFCKSILFEFAAKMNKEKPSYDTVRVDGLVPVFVSSLIFDGKKYNGQPGVNKKEAEQLVARAAILSILANPGEGMYLSEIVKSKAKLFSAVHAPPIHVGDPLVQRDTGVTQGAPAEGVSVGTSEGGEMIAIQEQSQVLPKHEFRKPGLETSSSPVPLPIAFVPSVQDQTSLNALAFGTKRKSKKRKKANKKGKTTTESQVLPLSEGMSCAVVLNNSI